MSDVHSPTPVAISIVIPAHDPGSVLLDQLDAIATSVGARTDCEILVVDNRSADGTAAAVERWSADAAVVTRVVSADQRAGEPHARNVGWQAAAGDLILYCDADDLVTSDWVDSLSGALAGADYATGPMRTAALNPDWMRRVRGSVFDGIPMLAGRVPYAHGCNMGFRRDALERLGGFDEEYLIACDLEIAVRAWRAGVELAFAPDAVVEYRLRTGWRDNYRQGRNYGRYRIRIRRLIPDVVDDAAERRATARRVLWLVRKAIPALWSRPTRARWIWVASQLDGEFRGWWEHRT